MNREVYVWGWLYWAAPSIMMMGGLAVVIQGGGFLQAVVGVSGILCGLYAAAKRSK